MGWNGWVWMEGGMQVASSTFVPGPPEVIWGPAVPVYLLLDARDCLPATLPACLLACLSYACAAACIGKYPAPPCCPGYSCYSLYRDRAQEEIEDPQELIPCTCKHIKSSKNDQKKSCHYKENCLSERGKNSDIPDYQKDASKLVKKK